MVWVDLIINGICLGGLYGMLGVGLALVTGVMRFVNISHGEFIVMAAFVGVFASAQLPGVNPLWFIVPVAVLFFFVGYGIQAVLFNKVVTAPDFLAPILLTFGFSIDAVAWRRLPRIAICAAVMGVMLFLAESFVAPVTADAGFAARITILGGLVAAGVSFYGLLLDLFGVINWGEAISNLRDGRLRE